MLFNLLRYGSCLLSSQLSLH